MAKTKYSYDNFLPQLSSKFSRRLEEIFADYNFDLGDEFEIAICDILRDFLPDKYGICRGHVVNQKGEKAGDDIIIFNKESFPTLRHLRYGDFSRKENIPIEAVFAYIEAKHKLTDEVFDKAVKQIKAVKKVASRREKMSIEQSDPYVPNKIISNSYSDSYPNFRNPIFTMIISKYCDGKYPKKTNKSTIKSFLTNKCLTTLSYKSKYFPEAIIAGPDHFIGVGYKDGFETIQPTIFLLSNKNFDYYVRQAENLSYGFALSKLFAALDWTRLNKINWVHILNEIKSTD